MRERSRAGFRMKWLPRRRALLEQYFSGRKIHELWGENLCCIKGWEEQTFAVLLVLRCSGSVENNNTEYLKQKTFL